MKDTLVLAAAGLWLVWVAGLLVFRRRPELRVGTLREFVYPVAALVIGLLWLGSTKSSPGSWFLALYMRAAVISGVLLTAVWLLSLLKRDTGIMDVAYPLAAAVPVVVLIAQRGSWSPHEIVTVALVALWSTRMSLHIGLRNAGHGEDGRYAAWRKRFGPHWWWWSFFQVFMMQGVTVWLWSLGLVGAVAAGPHDLGWQHGLALLLFATGFYFQVVGDLQLERFKKARTDRSQVLDTGLWRLTRHPNYFGEAVVWWSFGALGLVHPWGWLALVCPLYVTWFMGAGSATPMQDRYLAKTKPAYADYMRRVPTFFSMGHTEVIPSTDLQGRSAIVTGAGKGLGRAYALHLAAHGASVLVNNRRHPGESDTQTSAAQTVAAIRAAGGTADANWSDVNDPESGPAMVQQALDKFGGLDIVVANAGVDTPTAFHKQSLADFRAIFDTGFFGNLHLAHAAWPHLLGQRYGRMVLTASSAGLHANHGQSAYSAAKAAVIGLMRSLAIEGRRHGVLVNAIAPYGYSQMTAPYMPAAMAQSFAPALVAPVVGWLCSAQCDTSGEVVVTGGGLVRRASMGESDGMPLHDATVGDVLRALKSKALHAYDSANDSFARFLQELARHSREPSP